MSRPVQLRRLAVSTPPASATLINQVATALLALGAFALLPATTMALLSEPRPGDGVALLCLGVIVVVIGYFGYAVASARPAAWPARVAQLLYAGLAAVWLVGHLEPTDHPWLTPFAVLALAAAPLAWSTRQAVTSVAAVVLSFAGVRLASLPLGVPTTRVADDAIYLLLIGLAFAAGGRAVMRAVELVDAAAAAAEAAVARAAGARVLQQEQHRQDAIVHDYVLAVLAAAVRGPIDAALRADAVTAFGKLRGNRSVRSTATLAMADRFRAVGREVRPDADIHVVLDDSVTTPPDEPAAEPAEIPEEVADALVEAMAEALRNTRTHAPDSSVTVWCELGASHVDVVVRDDGPGFDPTAVPPEKLGLRLSLGNRMASIGGEARWRSVPGKGTEVRLAWSL